ncbi:MAG: serine/threonine-protein kinase, partial [Solirubrobacteraceae bacterium]
MGVDRRVALKLIAPEWAGDEELRERFKHESRLVAALDHPNVIPVHDAGERDGLLYIAMRFVDGTDLRGLIDARGALDPRLAARITARVASALDAAHAAGLVHRDVKPANVLLAGGPGEEHPYLSDFGLSKRLDGDSGLTHSGQWLGTVDYVAPEQLTGQAVDHRTDVYSLAVLLFEALTGEVPFRGDSAPAKMTAKLYEPSPSLCERAPWLPSALEDVLARGIATAPGDRYQSAGELGRALVGAVGERA